MLDLSVSDCNNVHACKVSMYLPSQLQTVTMYTHVRSSMCLTYQFQAVQNVMGTEGAATDYSWPRQSSKKQLKYKGNGERTVCGIVKLLDHL